MSPSSRIAPSGPSAGGPSDPALPADASIVVIGGGITGVSVAYHLMAGGARDVLLVDKGELTSGTTFHSAGLVTQFRTSPTDLRLMRESVALYRAIHAEVGEASGWRPVGSLRLASTPEMLRALQRSAGRARALGLDVALIDPGAAGRLFPAMTTRGLLGAVHVPEDGYVEPTSITMELARRARAGGARVVTGTLVTGLERDGRGRIAAVVTDRGRVRTERVVNAAGQWAPRVAAMAGSWLPVVPLMHQYLTTRPVAGCPMDRDAPVVRDPANLVYLREETGGFLVGGFEPEPRVWAADGVPWSFTHRLLPPAWDLFEGLLEGAIRRCPALARAEVVQLVNGPDGFTPDGRYALGPVPGIPGLWVSAGMSINGVAGAGGVGRILAEWILRGEPPFDVSEIDVRRFGPHLREPAGLAARAREVYRYYYALTYPADEPEAGRPARVSALYERLAALGAVFQERGGWERAAYFEPGRGGRRQGRDEPGWGRPSSFDRIAAEHRTVRERVGILDMSSFGKLDVSGPGALAFLQRLCANDVDRPVGRLVYTQCLNARGGIECDLTVIRLGPLAFRVTTGTASAASDLGWLRLHLPGDGSVELRDVTEALAVVSVWGPRTRDVLAPLASADLSDAGFPYLTSREIEVAGVRLRANRVSFAGELGWELVVPRRSAGALWDALVAGGAAHGIGPVGYQALNTLRLEKGFFYWGDDIGPDVDPVAAGLGAFVRMAKGDFIGRDALVRLKAAGGPEAVMRTLVVREDAPVLWGGEPVMADGRVVARLRSAGYGHSVGAQLGLAYLPRALGAAGTRLEVEAFDTRLPAEVRSAPVWDPEGQRVRGPASPPG